MVIRVDFGGRPWACGPPDASYVGAAQGAATPTEAELAEALEPERARKTSETDLDAARLGPEQA